MELQFLEYNMYSFFKLSSAPTALICARIYEEQKKRKET